MSKTLIGLILALGMAGAVNQATAAPSGIGSHEALANSVTKAQYEDRYCRRLRRACEFKEERGETGEGNCRRYRRECGRYSR